MNKYPDRAIYLNYIFDLRLRLLWCTNPAKLWPLLNRYLLSHLLYNHVSMYDNLAHVGEFKKMNFSRNRHYQDKHLPREIFTSRKMETMSNCWKPIRWFISTFHGALLGQTEVSVWLLYNQRRCYPTEISIQLFYNSFKYRSESVSFLNIKSGLSLFSLKFS